VFFCPHWILCFPPFPPPNRRYVYALLFLFFTLGGSVSRFFFSPCTCHDSLHGSFSSSSFSLDLASTFLSFFPSQDRRRTKNLCILQFVRFMRPPLFFTLSFPARFLPPPSLLFLISLYTLFFFPKQATSHGAYGCKKVEGSSFFLGFILWFFCFYPLFVRSLPNSNPFFFFSIVL